MNNVTGLRAMQKMVRSKKSAEDSIKGYIKKAFPVDMNIDVM